MYSIVYTKNIRRHNRPIKFPKIHNFVPPPKKKNRHIYMGDFGNRGGVPNFGSEKSASQNRSKFAPIYFRIVLCVVGGPNFEILVVFQKISTFCTHVLHPRTQVDLGF